MKVVEELQQKLGGRDFFRSCDSLFYFQLGDDGCLPVLWHGNEGSLGSNQYHVNEKHCDNSENSSNLCQHLDNGVSMAMVVSQNGWFTMEKSHSKLDELGVPPWIGNFHIGCKSWELSTKSGWSQHSWGPTWVFSQEKGRLPGRLLLLWVLCVKLQLLTEDDEGWVRVLWNSGASLVISKSIAKGIKRVETNKTI